MKKSLLVLVFTLSFFSVFASSLDYGVTVTAGYGVKDNNLSFSLLPYVEVDDFKAALRIKWTPTSSNNDGFFSFDGSNGYGVIRSLLDYIQKITYGSLDDTFYIGLDRDFTFSFENFHVQNTKLGTGIPAYLQITTPYIAFKGFVDDISFEKKAWDALNNEKEEEIGAYDYRSNFIGFGVKIAQHKLSPVTVGLNILANLQSRYFTKGKVFSTYSYFIPQLDISYNTKFDDERYLSVGASISSDIPNYNIDSFDTLSEAKFDKWNSNFLITLFGNYEHKNMKFGLTLFTSQRQFMFRRAGKDAFEYSGHYLNYVPLSASGFAFDFDYDISENLDAHLSFVFPVSNSFTILEFEKRTYDTLGANFNLSIDKALKVYGGIEIEGFIGMLKNGTSLGAIFESPTASINAGATYKIKDNITATGKFAFKGIDKVTDRADLSFTIGVTVGLKDYIEK